MKQAEQGLLLLCQYRERQISCKTEGDRQLARDTAASVCSSCHVMQRATAHMMVAARCPRVSALLPEMRELEAWPESGRQMYLKVCGYFSRFM